MLFMELYEVLNMFTKVEILFTVFKKAITLLWPQQTLLKNVQYIHVSLSEGDRAVRHYTSAVHKRPPSANSGHFM